MVNIRVPEAMGTQDYFGLNYYTRNVVSFDLRNARELFSRESYPADADLSFTKFIANVPEGLFELDPLGGALLPRPAGHRHRERRRVV